MLISSEDALCPKARRAIYSSRIGMLTVLFCDQCETRAEDKLFPTRKVETYLMNQIPPRGYSHTNYHSITDLVRRRVSRFTL
jgi:hypothetical protein